MKDRIKLEYVINDGMHVGSIDREEFLQNMEYLVEAFPHNNEIATKLVELIPNMTCIRVDKILNDTQDVPFIWYQTAQKDGIIKILRYHSIIWGFLQHYCNDTIR